MSALGALIAVAGAAAFTGTPDTKAPNGTPAQPQALSMVDVSLVAETVADTATRFCIDVLSRKVSLPAPGATAWWQAYKLNEGIPKAAMDALGSGGASIIAGATLASGSASDGDFVVALGGGAGETCRLIVYRAVPASGLAARTATAMSGASRGWKPLPTPPQYAAANKASLVLRRDGKPYLANLLTPTTSGSVVMAAIIAAVPPQVALPSGF